jgi:cell division protein DivIC
MAKKRRSSQFKDTSQVIDIEEARRKRQEKRQKQQRQQRLEQQQREEARSRKSRASVKAGRRKKSFVYAVIILAIIAAIGTSILNIVTLKADYNEAKAENDQLVQQKKELEQQIENSGEKEYIEKEARVQLRMVKPGETVYVVP